MTAADRPAFDLSARDDWSAVALHGEHAGFQHVHVAEGVLTVRTGFAPSAAHRAEAADLPERFLSQTRVGFSADGSTWDWADYEDSLTAQRVRIERERAGIPAEAVPSAAEHLLVGPAAAGAGDAEGGTVYARLEEGSPLQGGLRTPQARLVVSDAGDGDAAVAVVIEGVTLGAHLVRSGRVVASDFGGGTVATPVAGRDDAVAGLDEHVVTFASLPVE